MIVTDDLVIQLSVSSASHSVVRHKNMSVPVSQTLPRYDASHEVCVGCFPGKRVRVTAFLWYFFFFAGMQIQSAM